MRNYDITLTELHISDLYKPKRKSSTSIKVMIGLKTVPTLITILTNTVFKI
jgi:hypothetical protein